MSDQVATAEQRPTPSLIGAFSAAVPAGLLRQESREVFRDLVFAGAALSTSMLIDIWLPSIGKEQSRVMRLPLLLDEIFSIYGCMVGRRSVPIQAGSTTFSRIIRRCTICSGWKWAETGPIRRPSCFWPPRSDS